MKKQEIKLHMDLFEIFVEIKTKQLRRFPPNPKMNIIEDKINFNQSKEFLTVVLNILSKNENIKTNSFSFLFSNHHEDSFFTL